MLVFRIATRNLFRQFRRNVLSMVSIIMGVFVIVAGRGFQNGLNENMIRAQIDSGSGHVMAVPADYPTKGFRQPVADAFPLPDATRTWLDEHTTSCTGRASSAAARGARPRRRRCPWCARARARPGAGCCRRR